MPRPCSVGPITVMPWGGGRNYADPGGVGLPGQIKPEAQS